MDIEISEKQKRALYLIDNRLGKQFTGSTKKELHEFLRIWLDKLPSRGFLQHRNYSGRSYR